MNKGIVEALAELGLIINDIQYKYPPADNFGFLNEEPTKFILKGGFHEEAEMEQLINEIMILRAVHNNKHPAAADLFEQLKTITGITSE